MEDASRRKNLLDGSIIEGAKEQLLATTSDVQQFAGNVGERVGLLKAKEELGIFKGRMSVMFHFFSNLFLSSIEFFR